MQDEAIIGQKEHSDESGLGRINIFDFDGTLSTDTWPKFWVWVSKFGLDGRERNEDLEEKLSLYRNTHKGDHLETFFGFFSDLLTKNNESLTDDELMEGEKYIVYNPGVVDFLKNSKAKNYIVSGGLEKFLKKLKISKYFDGIYGTSVNENQSGEIIKIGTIMTNEKKIESVQDILLQNGRINDDCTNVVYIGDGYSDAESMRFVHERGGRAIFVHQPDGTDKFALEYNTKIFKKLQSLNVVDESLVADYREGSTLRARLDDVRN